MITFSPLSYASISVYGSAEYSATESYDVNYKLDENPSENPCSEFSNAPVGDYKFKITRNQNSSFNFGGSNSGPLETYCEPGAEFGWSKCPASFASPFGNDCISTKSCSEGGTYSVFINDDLIYRSGNYTCNTSVDGANANSNCAQQIKELNFSCPGSNFPRPDGPPYPAMSFSLVGGCAAADGNGVIYLGEDNYFDGLIPYKYYAIYGVVATSGIFGSLELFDNSNTYVSGENILRSNSSGGGVTFLMDLSTPPRSILVYSSGSYSVEGTSETEVTTYETSYSESYNSTIQIDFS